MNSKSLIAIVVLVFIVISFGIFISLRGSSRPGVPANNKTVALIAPKNLVEVSDITGDPLVYDGLSVEVEAKINEWVTKKSFKFTTSGGVFGGGGKPLFVIRKDPFALPQINSINKLGLGEKVRVHIKGRVVIVNRDQLEENLGVNLESEELKLDDNKLTSWKLGPVLLLDTVEKL